MWWRNLILLGDCLNAVSYLQKEYQGKFRLIYIDPPFFSGTDYSLRRKGEPKNGHAPNVTEKTTYSDKWEGGLEEYLEFMRARLEGMKNLLSNNGSLWVHIDFHVSHYLKIVLDEIFGYQNFVNEIIWKRTNSPKTQSRGFGSQHDVILLYARDIAEFRTNPVFRPHDITSLKPYSYKDERGKFRLIEIEAQGIQRSESRKQFEWQGRVAPYLYRKETLDDWWDNNLIYTSRNCRYTKKQYLEDMPGVQVSDLWFDIPPIQGSSEEYTGFLTQKPLLLLKRIIESATDPGDLVGDFFAGSGTTPVAACKASRKWIVCDSSEIAINLTTSRLENIDNRGTYELINLGIR
ncbi:MAG: site-specific DNA-methyltransferase [Candidatus Thorarchaeota archaeon]|nr:site-specific DNA-methyltransferase [Candidatus Thorarchaeota archaeon]